MDRIPQTPPPIKPLPPQTHSPLWSVMIPVYNCSDYLKESLTSVLRQDMGPERMQIEVIDDASTDADVEALVQQMGQGRVSYYRQPQNVGSLRNFETSINRSCGKLVHLLHGDDRVLPGFYAKFTELFERFPEAGAAFCNYHHIDKEGNPLNQQPNEMDDDGILPDWVHTIAKNQRLQYISTVVKRSVYEHLGSFYGVTYGEDWEMWVRIARFYPVAYTPQALAEYRVHTNSISNEKILTGQVLRDLSWVMNVIQSYLDDNRKKVILAESRRIWAFYGLELANEVWLTTQSPKGVNAIIREALRLHIGAQIVWKVVKLYANIALQAFRPASR